MTPLAAATDGAAQSQIPREFGAAGAPYLDPARCNALPDIITRMKAGLPQQDEWIDRTDRMLRDAQEGKLGSEAERRNFFLKTASGFATKIVGQVATLRKGLEALHALSPAQAAVRLTLLERLEALTHGAEVFNQAIARGEALVNYRQLVEKQMAGLKQFVALLSDSGMTDELASWGANLAMPVVGPILVEVFTLGRDLAFAELQLNFSEEDLRQHRSNLQEMKNAKRRNELILRDLQAEQTVCSRPKPEDSKPRGRPIEQGGAQAGRPGAEPVPVAQPVAKGKSPVKLVIGLAGLTAAAIVGYQAYAELQALELEGVDDGGSGSGTGSGGGMTYVGNSTGGIQCTFNAGGLLSNCNATVTVNIQSSVGAGRTLRLTARNANPGGNATSPANVPGNMTFSLTGGRSVSSCPSPVTTLDLLDAGTQAVLASATGLSIPFTCR